MVAPRQRVAFGESRVVGSERGPDWIVEGDGSFGRSGKRVRHDQESATAIAKFVRDATT